MILPTITADELYAVAAASGARPEPLQTISQWADKYRMLSRRASAEPGPWRTERTPYLREIMDCLSPSSPIERVVFMKGAQIGGTECGNNWIGYVIHQAPGPMMAVQPTVDMAKRNSKQRVDPLIEESDVLRKLVREPLRLWAVHGLSALASQRTVHARRPQRCSLPLASNPEEASRFAGIDAGTVRCEEFFHPDNVARVLRGHGRQ